MRDMDRKPSELLTRAADLIRDTAAQLSPGPWEDYTNGIIWDADGNAIISEQTRKDAKWIALLNPAVAAPLEQWLRETAARASVNDLVNGGGSAAHRYAESRYGAALLFAKAVLDRPEEET